MKKRGHFHPSRCKVCGAHSDDVGGISQTGLCFEHSRERFEANLSQLRAHDGPWFEHWRRRMAACVGAVTVDDLAALLPADD